MQTATHTRTAAQPMAHPDTESADILAATVDRLAQIKADIVALQLEEAELKADLIESGAELIEGTLHRAAITYGTTRTTTNWRAVAEHMKASRQLIKAHTTKGEPYDTVKVSAKSTT